VPRHREQRRRRGRQRQCAGGSALEQLRRAGHLAEAGDAAGEHQFQRAGDLGLRAVAEEPQGDDGLFAWQQGVHRRAERGAELDQALFGVFDAEQVTQLSTVLAGADQGVQGHRRVGAGSFPRSLDGA